MTQNKTDFGDTPISDQDRQKLAGLLAFAQDVLTARERVQMVMAGGLGVFHEGDIAGLPGIHLNEEDGTWLRIERQRETRPPEPASHVATFLQTPATDPAKPPALRSAVTLEVTIEEASDLIDGGLLRPDHVHPLVEKEITVENRVKVTLHAQDCPEMRRDFDAYVAGSWADWAVMERPVRRAISLYNDLFKIYSAIRTSDTTPPELVWGMAIGRWKIQGGPIDMPLIEQLVDIDVAEDGDILITPRDLQPSLSLKPYLEVDIPGADKLQHKLQDSLSKIFGDTESEVSPFTTLWEPLVGAATSELSSTGRHISRADIDKGARLPAAADTLCFTSSWAIFGRPRSTEARGQDLAALRAQVSKPGTPIPASIRGYVSPAPDPVEAPKSDWGIDSAVLGGKVTKGWEPAEGPAREPSATPAPGSENPQGHRVHFFPLPFNEEQGKISDMIDDPNVEVVCVSGPPGTGKSHTIANIISHLMATGKRVLVTARTAEAIAAVREKLPASLQPLVIASIGTDRDSAKQLQEAVTELSNEVVTLNINEARETMERLEQQIIDCDRRAAEADRMLGEIARANLAPLTWKGVEKAPMEMVALLASEAEDHEWFTDRPAGEAPAQLSETLDRLKLTLRTHAADMDYAGIALPSPELLPTTPDLIAAHETELSWNGQEPVDYSAAPPMARDTSGAETMAKAALEQLESCARQISGLGERTRGLAIAALGGNTGVSQHKIEAFIGFVEKQLGANNAADVRFELGDCGLHDLEEAAKRGAAGLKPVGFSFFGGALKSAVASVRVGEVAPSRPEEWRAVAAACRLLRQRSTIMAETVPLMSAGLAPELPHEGWAIASYLKNRQAEMSAALNLANRLAPVIEAMKALFPYGLDIKAISERLDCDAALFALRANLQTEHQVPEPVRVLRHLSGEGSQPLFRAMANLADAIGQPDTDPRNIVALRAEITRELQHLASVADKLTQIDTDLQILANSGAPDWAARLRAEPLDAEELIPGTWREAWAWGQMKGQVETIISLGNGDVHRKAKAEAMQRRRSYFVQLIRVRTLLGLHRRMTPAILTAMQAFTQAVKKIGTGKGIKAPRFIRAAQEAAKQASRAAPVWIMPEYKIPEQLPPELGDFDLVILDEASQSDITAIAALARGKKILIVGDEEQVSPTAVGIPAQKINAMRAMHLAGLPNADLIDENSSIFEITKRMYPTSHVMLREHFRCVAPIIQFSTRFYNNALVPLRVPRASERFDPPLCDVFIRNAVRQGKTNASEAKWIVEEIARLVQDPAHKGRDIGVISLIGNEQSEKIGRMLIEDKRIGPEVIEARRIIYGDARTMQGQERSIVFLSMVATPDQVTSQTARSDQQRINVAMSRAKDRLYLVRSVALGDLKPADIKAQILQHFQDPMPGGRVFSGQESESLVDRCQSGFEREVLQRLLEANYRVRPQVAAGGFSIDMVVEGENDRRLAIELDGDAFHGPDVWDRDMARQAALERAGWVFWRVFGSQWNHQKDYWWENLVETLDRMQIAPIGAIALDERFTETIEVGRSTDDDIIEDETLTPWDGTGPKPQLMQEVDEAGTLIYRDGPAEVIPDADADINTSQKAASGQEGATRAQTRETAEKPAPDTASETRRPTLGIPRPSPSVTSTDEEESSSTTESSSRQGRTILTVPRRTEAPRQGAFDLPVNDLFAHANGASSVPVAIGSTVMLQRIEDGSQFEIILVESGNDPANNLVSVKAPLGEALIDAVAGDDVTYHVGTQSRTVRVLRVS